jgi:hypothetical protein
MEFIWDLPLVCQISKFWVRLLCSWIPKLGWDLLNQTQVLTFLSRNLYEEYPKDVKFQNSEYFSWFLDPIIVTKSAIRFDQKKLKVFLFLRWNRYVKFKIPNNFSGF